jgi:signal transduction histidine kinase
MTEAVAWLSQELRTQLNGILGFVQLMQRDTKEPLAPRQRLRADEISKAGEHVSGLLGKLMDLCWTELGQVSLQIAPTDPRELIEAVRASVAALAARAGVELSAGASEGSHIPLMLADAGLLHRILTTLVLRAINQPHRPRRVALQLSAAQLGIVRVKVSDDGSGIHPDDQATLLLPLRRTRGADGIEATGLPLAIAQRLAELMHCQLRFRSAPNRGSEFWIDVPASG